MRRLEGRKYWSHICEARPLVSRTRRRGAHRNKLQRHVGPSFRGSVKMVRLMRWDSHLVACLDVAIQKATGKKSASLGEQGQEQKDSEQWRKRLTLQWHLSNSITKIQEHDQRGLWCMQIATLAMPCCQSVRLFGTNASLETSGEQLQVRLIDFEMVGVVASARADSDDHASPDWRGCERRLVSNYHQRLTTFCEKPWSRCRRIHLEVCQNMSLEVLGDGMASSFLLCQMPHFGAQFFHDQLVAFLHDHILIHVPWAHLAFEWYWCCSDRIPRP